MSSKETINIPVRYNATIVPNASDAYAEVNSILFELILSRLPSVGEVVRIGAGEEVYCFHVARIMPIMYSNDEKLIDDKVIFLTPRNQIT